MLRSLATLEMGQNYKDTLNLPRTDFPMKANLAAREPEMLRNWEEERLYQEIQKLRESRELFVLHDGPPFANGDVHMGTALNKILKDFVVKSQTMLGKRAPYVLLRAKYASSPAEEFIHGRFNEILGSPEAGPADNVKRIIFCSGKVYYDLLKYRSDRKIDDAAIIRIEQLYPLAEKRLREMLKPFPKNAKFVWCQEEPQNMGAWTFIEPRLRTLFCTEIAYAGREASASPAWSRTRFPSERTLRYKTE